MNNTVNPALVCRILILLVVTSAVFSVGCSRNPSKPDRQSVIGANSNQPKFSEVSSEPSDTGQILALAEAAYAAKDWEAAEKHYVATTKSIPKEAIPWFRLGNIYARTDRPDFAVRAYKEALLRDPEMSKAWYNMGLVQLRQSANSFLQMRTYTQDNSESQIRADTMYEATIALIKDGPKRTKTYPYASGGTVDAPRVNVLPAVELTQDVNDTDPDAEAESMIDNEQDSSIQSVTADPVMENESSEETGDAPEVEASVEPSDESPDMTQ